MRERAGTRVAEARIEKGNNIKRDAVGRQHLYYTAHTRVVKEEDLKHTLLQSYHVVHLKSIEYRKSITLQLKEKDISMLSQTLLFIFLYPELLELDNLQACCIHPCHTGPSLSVHSPPFSQVSKHPLCDKSRAMLYMSLSSRVWKWTHQASPEQASDQIT